MENENRKVCPQGNNIIDRHSLRCMTARTADRLQYQPLKTSVNVVSYVAVK